MGAGSSSSSAAYKPETDDKGRAATDAATAAATSAAAAVVSLRTELLDAVGRLADEPGGRSTSGDAAFTTSRGSWQSFGGIELAKPPAGDRKSAIGVTLGPAVDEPLRLTELLNCGINFVRVNMSHANQEWGHRITDHLRYFLHANPGKVCALAVELAGPELRVGRLSEFADTELKLGHECVISGEPSVAAGGSSSERFYVGHGALGASAEAARAAAAADKFNFATVVAPGALLHIKGAQLITLQVVECGGVVPGQEISDKEIRCTVIRPGRLGSRARVFPAPDIVSGLPSLSDQDFDDLGWAVNTGSDFIILPCVRNAKQLARARAAIKQVCAETGEQVHLLAKIENEDAVTNFDEILDASDGLVLARDELEIELGATKAALVQKMAMAKAKSCGKPMVCTGLLGSMANRRGGPSTILESSGKGPGEPPVLNRNEASDVLNSILDGTDSLLLTAETSVGLWPVEAINRLHTICVESEGIIDGAAISRQLRAECNAPRLSQEAVAVAAVAAAHEQHASLIVVLTEAGLMGRLVSKYQPVPTVLVVCESERVCRQSYLPRGLVPMVANLTKRGLAAALKQSLTLAKTVGYCKSGDNVVVVTDADLLDDEAAAGASMRVFPLL